MSDTHDRSVTPAQRVDDVPRTLDALRQAVQEALRRHKLASNPVAVWRNGQVEWVAPEDIPIPTEETGQE